MQALGVTDTRNLSSIVPGFTAADNGYNTPVYTLRGIGYADTTYTATSTVGVYVDEVSLPYAIMTKGANLDIKRVEVLKGPQGTLYGRNTTGGAINYIANKPTDDFQYGVTAGYGSYSTEEAEGFVSGPISDSLKGRVALKGILSQDGWQYSQTRPDDTLGKKRKMSGRGLLEWSPDADLVFRLSVDGWLDKSDAQAAQAIAFSPQNPFIPNTPFGAQFPILGPIIGVNPILAPQVRNYPLIPQNSDNTRVADWPEGGPWQLNDSFYGTSLRTNWSLTDTKQLTGILSYGYVQSDGSGIPNTGLNVYNVEQQIYAHIATYNAELRFSDTIGDSIHYLTGISAAHDDGVENHHVRTDTNSAVFPNPLTGQALIANKAITFGATKATSLGVFANADWSFTDTLKATLGARYGDDRRTYHGCTIEPEDSQGISFGPIIDLVALIQYGAINDVRRGECFILDDNGKAGEYSGELHEANISGRASLDWTPIERTLLYTSYSRGFKAGGFPVVNSISQSQLAPTTQEKLQAWEIGAKSSLIDHILHANAATFYYDYTNKQLLTFFKDPLFGVLPILDNVPKSKVYGAETDIQYTPVQGLFLSVAGSYIKTRIDEYTGTNSKGEQEDFAGRPFNFTPVWQYTVLGDYTFPIVSTLNLGFGADYTYTGKTNATLEGNPDYDMRSYGLVNARIHLAPEDGKWNATVWGRNIFDEFSTIGVFRTGDTVARTTGMPRTFGLTFTYNGF
ncbi:MAG: hypothetical protein JWQ90_323 [Hydrocarboniphaga sp.]|nr:hypothetical protein [Hydrocarboniphaga sp.]